MLLVRRFYPLAAFLGGFIWDALTLGQKVKVTDFWRLGLFLLGAALLALFLAHRQARELTAPAAGEHWRGRLAELVWLAPYLLLQFFFGGIFSALFILYFKSSGHLGTWLTTALLGMLLVGNEFAGQHLGRRFTLIWALFALNAILLCNFVLPHAVGSLNPNWFYVSTAAGVVLAHGLRGLAAGRPGRIFPAWGLAGALLLAWSFDMIAPVPLVRQDLAVGHDFVQDGAHYTLQVERAPSWQVWREQAASVHLLEGERLYGVSAVFAPLGLTAALEHRWEVREDGRWRVVYRNRFQTTGGREKGFRGYSWVLNPQPGDWRFIVATQDGRTIGILPLRVVRGAALSEAILLREF
jgi:MFS family permease